MASWHYLVILSCIFIILLYINYLYNKNGGRSRHSYRNFGPWTQTTRDFLTPLVTGSTPWIRKDGKSIIVPFFKFNFKEGSLCCNTFLFTIKTTKDDVLVLKEEDYIVETEEGEYFVVSKSDLGLIKNPNNQ